ncbi:hypothetical protein ABZ949_10605 [Micromonospora tulbaghiae]|uniref:hypothetical protein n=1 Tax=Micromonospora tulbaghiae TaxID=479978 RepID=UPI003405EDB3
MAFRDDHKQSRGAGRGQVQEPVGIGAGFNEPFRAGIRRACRGPWRVAAGGIRTAIRSLWAQVALAAPAQVAAWATIHGGGGHRRGKVPMEPDASMRGHIGPFKTGLTDRRGLWRTCDQAEIATFEYVD